MYVQGNRWAHGNAIIYLSVKVNIVFLSAKIKDIINIAIRPKNDFTKLPFEER